MSDSVWIEGEGCIAVKGAHTQNSIQLSHSVMFEQLVDHLHNPLFDNTSDHLSDYLFSSLFSHLSEHSRY